jgi:hypothetical protein
MMSFANRRREVEERRIQRRERETAAGRLADKAPDLASLSIEMHETRPEGCVSDNQYIRRIVVEHAPALFEIPCSYPQCEGGGYDLTREILRAIALQRPRFEGEIACRGQCATLDCKRVLRYIGTATYREASGAAAGPFSHETTTR